MEAEFYWVFLVFIVNYQTCKGCGSITHIELAHRARSYFNVVSEGVDYQQLLQRHEDAFQAGAPYPDAYYPGLCFDGDYHSISEDTHWTPFINVTVEYIRREYPQPWTREAEKLVVFLLSVVSHQVTDVNWHSLDIQQGFLRTMGEINYHGSYGDAHNDGDFGGDVLNLYGLDLDYIGRVTKWYVPTLDLYNIYQDYYGEVKMPIDVIENCTAWLFLGRLGETLGVVEKLYPVYAQRSPFLTDQLQDYFLGGMDDMAVWSSNVWRYTIDMLDRGTDVCDLPENPIFITCNTIQFYQGRYETFKRMSKALDQDITKQVTPRRQKRYLQQGKVNEVFTENVLSEFEDEDLEDLVSIKRTKRGIQIRPKRRLRRILHRKLRKMKNVTKLPTQQIEGADNIFDTMNVTEPNVFYTGENEYGRLGESLQTGDYNGDGHQDLVIGSPAFSVPNNFQEGSVYVVYGSATGLPMFTDDIQNIANVTLSGTELNGRFGTVMSTCDLNKDGVDDLVVSAPSVGSGDLTYHGVIYVFFGNTQGLHSSPDITMRCTQVYCNLGWSLHSTDVDSDGAKDLVIGAPFAPAGGEQRGFVGILLANDSYTGGTELTEGDLDWMFNGEQDYSWLGYSVVGFHVGQKSWLLAGAPTYRICYREDCQYDNDDVQSAGRVYAFELPNQNYSFVLTGKEEFAQFGYKIHATDVSENMVVFITAATAESVSTTKLNLTQAGAVYVYHWSTIQLQPLHTIYGDRTYSRFGNNIMVSDFDGDSVDDVIITAGLWSYSYFDQVESGRAFGFSDFDNLLLDSVSASEADTVYGIPDSKLRFGYSSAFIETSQGKTLVFGVPHSNNGARMSGEIALLQL